MRGPTSPARDPRGPPLARTALRLPRLDPFLTGLVLAVVVASIAPDLGRSGGALRLDAFADVGVFAVFLLHGLGLPTGALRHGASRWRLHLLVQLSTYALFPLWWVLWAALLADHLPPDLSRGFLFLAALPSTVSSSVALTALARGNVAAAILNASLSSLLGIVLTPLLVSLAMPATAGALDAAGAIAEVARLLLLPFALGQLLRPLLAARLAPHKHLTSRIDRGVILMLVALAFSDAVAGGLWQRHGPLLLLEALAGAALFLFPALWATRALARAFGLPVEDEIALVFCGSKKTLASGVPMAQALFGASAATGVLVLPIMVYHQLQLFVGTLLARRYAARPAAPTEPPTE